MGLKRIMPQCTKDKISAKLCGRKMSDETKQKISIGMKNAWAKVPKTTELWATENNSDKTSNKDESTKV